MIWLIVDIIIFTYKSNKEFKKSQEYNMQQKFH